MIDFRWSEVKVKDDEDIIKAKLFDSLQKQADEEISPKSYWMIVWLLRYRSQIEEKNIKKIYFKVIFSIKFLW